EHVEGLRRRFAAEVADGRLTVVDCAVAAEPGRAEFYLSDKEHVWHSLERRFAEQGGSGCRAIEVECRTFGSILSEYGVPYYLKIDRFAADENGRSG
ncbi:hypothetical protein NL361_26990, partial [Klebsiella pneumoniae]|nr:hypothetical protein [Klebsiella pneumoniae]